MAIPAFVLELRARIGHDPLPLPSVTAVVLDAQDRILLVRRSDTDQWALVTGCLEPGEQPAVGASREVEEETSIRAAVERLVSVSALPLMVCPNGDQVHWLDVTFRCRATDGQARVNDDESVDVGWFDQGELPELPARHLNCIRLALDGNPAAVFEDA
jgi:ADP-ribose pyrophosphatase YjhB (NUDIX family)